MVTPEQRDWAEGVLVDAAREMDARTLAKVGTQLRARLDQDGAAPSDAELANPVNELRFVTKPNGRLAFRGELAPEASALLQAVISPLAKPRPSTDEGPDPRTPAERHGDALVEALQLAAHSADSDGLPSEAGEKPHILVTVSVETLRDGVGQALLDGAGQLDAASARRIACDCKLIPAVLGANSEPLDLGRASYTVSAALRRALVVRDGGCAFPGCDRPHRWCHAHHVRHWADGGPPTWRTWSCSAASTIAWSTIPNGSAPLSMGAPNSPHPHTSTHSENADETSSTPARPESGSAHLGCGGP